MRFYQNVADRPFASALAFLLFATAITTLAGLGLNADALEPLVPRWVIIALSLTYGFGGLCLLVGMLFTKGNWEAAGCILVGSGLAVRTIALFSTMGFTPPIIATAVFYLVFGWACIERFRQIMNGDQIIRVHKQVEIQFEDNGVNDDSS